MRVGSKPLQEKTVTSIDVYNTVLEVDKKNLNLHSHPVLLLDVI